MGPYGKHNGGAVYQQFRDEDGRTGGGVGPSWLSPYTTFEGPDPRRWCANGYAVVNVDPRATWWSGGEYSTFWDEREAHNAVDMIAWAGTQSWSNGRVGMSGVSYLAGRPVVGRVAAPALPRGHQPLRRPQRHLPGVRVPRRNSLELSDLLAKNRLGYSTSKVEAMADMMVDHPLNDAYWDTKRPDLGAIDVPAYVIASWSDQGLHTRGTLVAFEQIGSQHKYLEVHGGKKWEYYHRPSTVVRQRPKPPFVSCSSTPPPTL